MLLCFVSQCNNAHVKAPSPEECCGCAVEATVCLGPCCCLSKLFTGVARGPLLPLHQVRPLQWHLKSPLLGSQVLLHDMVGCDLVEFIMTTFYICFKMTRVKCSTIASSGLAGLHLAVLRFCIIPVTLLSLPSPGLQAALCCCRPRRWTPQWWYQAATSPLTF